MSFLTATNVELIYNMPAYAGNDTTVSTAAIVTPATGSAVPPAYLPPVFSIWQPSTVVGKGFRVNIGGTYDVSGATNLTFKYALDSTEATFGTAIAATGAAALANTTAGAWYATFDIIFTAVAGNGQLSGFVNGTVTYGQANNAGTNLANTYMLGGATSSGAQTTAFSGATWVASTAYYWECQVTASAAPTHFQCTEHQIFGLN